jgi:uncharacterized membrane protein
MTAIATASISDFANAVRMALSDLPPHQAQAVLEGLDEHLAEIASEGTEDLETALGTPEAYAAEMRASAGFGISTAERQDTRTPAAETAKPKKVRESFFARHRRFLARAAGVVAFGLLAIIVIRISRPVNGIEIVAGSLFAAGGWWVLRKVCEASELPAAVSARVPKTLAFVALVLAVLAGGVLGHSKTVYVRGSTIQPVPITNPTFIPAPIDNYGRPDLGRFVPDLIGESYENTVPMLAALGLRSEKENAGGISVIAMKPAPGTLVPFDTVIVLTTGPLETTTSPQSESSGAASATATPSTAPSSSVPFTVPLTSVPETKVVPPSTAPPRLTFETSAEK